MRQLKELVKMNTRTNNTSKMNFAVLELEKYYEEFENEFTSFFEELRVFSNHKILELKNL